MSATHIPSGAKVLRPSEACAKIGLGRSKLYQLMANGELQRIQLSKNAVGLLEHELDAWLASRARVVG